MTDGMVSARFRMELPDGLWTKELSTRFPTTQFRLLAGVPVEGGSMALGEVTGEHAPAAAEAIRTHEAIREYDELYADTTRAIAQYKGAQKPFFEFFDESAVPPEFPVVTENGIVEFDVTVTREQFEHMGDVLDESDTSYELVSVVSNRDSESLLTDRQRECLAVALRAGYFEIPRDCTLADVADRIDVDKSTASKTIRRGSARVIEWFLVGQDARHTP
ncbi:bacterio-opsin activator [Halonotius terrestris]|uniref:Bacterio-opsin activator n=1 Tax=Halonotius terrestris TaxID=2487750 RepID=A0A8J8PCI8_9EURY|nr:helix-turn-helix domain-containing protein [Halonotius terrestris]TQQ82687.1 bacterio-opsin activator [Halonotius terrestris]